MWNKIGTILVVVIPLITGVFWLSENMVRAEEFTTYQQEQTIRWLRYDADKLWREYQELKAIENPTLIERTRLENVIRQIKENDAKIESLRR